jgi:tetratricopeptide (TPR) repeat protein
MQTSTSIALAVLLSLTAVPSVVFAMGGDPAPAPARAPGAADFARGRAAIDHKDWPEAISAFEKVVAQDSKNADAYNWLGYASRKSGKLDAAFKYYDKALSLDPKHRGAYEYQGEAFLMANQPAKAESNLATLAKLCNSSCEEYQDLKEAIADFKAGKKP